MKFSTALLGGLSLAGLASAIPTSEKRTPHPRANPTPEHLRELLARSANNQRRSKLNATKSGWNITAHAPGGKHYSSHPSHEKANGGKSAKKPTLYNNHSGHKKGPDGKGKGKGGEHYSKPGSGGESPKPTSISPPVGFPTVVPEPVDTCEACPAASSNAINAPASNVWLGLTHDEAAAATSFLFAQESLNLTISEDAGEWDNTLLLVELQLPSKAETLAYLDKSGPAPARYAHAIVDFRATEEPYMRDYLVGPLPITDETKLIPYDAFSKGVGKARNYNADEGTRGEWMKNITLSIEDITLDLWNKTIANDDVYLWGIDPLWPEDGRIIAWEQIWSTADDQFGDTTLLPLGLYIKSDITGRDPSKWKTLGVVYNDIFYDSLDAFRTAWSTPGFVKNGANSDGTWAQTDREGPILPRETLAPPMQVSPGGQRYSIDIEKQYIEWMGFSFYLAFSRDTGIRLFDIRFKGERIIYELGLMEALAHYAGNDPTQSGTAYLDAFYGFGPYTFQLVEGYDCPQYATYLNSTFYAREKSRTHPGSICVFEADAGYPISRHSTQGYVTVTKNIHLVVRSIATVGNYDYMFQYTFSLDGSIAVEVRASGYIQSAYFAANNNYGYQINDFLSGSMHDHVLNFKADFDILGTKNSISTTEFIPTVETYAWSKTPKNTMKLKKGYVEKETGINWPYNNNMQYHIINKAEKNKFGEYRAYKIAPMTPPSHVTVEASSNLHETAEWAKKHFWITQRKEDEASSTHPYNPLDVLDPVVNFGKYVDGESIVQEDLVLWFNLGMHHVPNTQDLPNTAFTSAHAGVVFEPVNFNSQNPSKQSVHAVRVSYDNGDVLDVETYEAEKPECSIKLEAPDLMKYQGDVAIRKFPYDPNDWFFKTESI